MTVSRSCVVLAALAGIALVVVGLRAEQTRCAGRTLRIESEWAQRRRDLWNLQTQVSRLRAPGRIHEGVTRFDAGVIPPGDVPPGPSRLLVANYP